MGRNVTTFVLSCLLLTKAFAQESDEKKVGLPSIGVGIGMMTYYGDVGLGKKLSPFTGSTLGYHVNVHERLGFIGLSFNALSGKLSANESSGTRRLNFSTSILDMSLNVVFHFDNGFILPKKSIFAPYISAGFGYVSFNPTTDLKDKYGNTYYYWSDGFIRNKSEEAPDKASAVKINRDYVYETTLPAAGDSANNDFVKYNKNSFSIPLSVGMLLKLSPSFNVNIGATYYLTQTDWLDNVSSESKGIRKGDAQNDQYLYSFLALQYNIGKSKKNKSTSSDVDFSSLEKGDTDKDGVNDVDDKCADTPAGVKVDSDGCPLDSDGDGIYDYLDKEPKTKRGAIVDANGVALQDDNLVIEHEASARVTRSADPKPQAPAGVSSGSSPSSSDLPEMYKDVDTNKDGKISTDEINGAIDNFFEGNSKLSIDGIYKLIDYFFEQ